VLTPALMKDRERERERERESVLVDTRQREAV
jgi:hypothetical protein